jgi:protoporphyrinogen oxidase
MDDKQQSVDDLIREEIDKQVLSDLSQYIAMSLAEEEFMRERRRRKQEQGE